MIDLTQIRINAAGEISQSFNGTLLNAVIRGPSRRVLTTFQPAAWSRRPAQLPIGISVDVTEAWGTDALSAVVAAILSGGDLPPGFRRHINRRGVDVVQRVA